MADRDDYEAAVEHAADLERELTRARVEQAHDRERIAELEAQLADARRRADAARSGKMPQESGKSPQESGKKPQTAVRGSRVFWPAFSSLAVAILVGAGWMNNWFTELYQGSTKDEKPVTAAPPAAKAPEADGYDVLGREPEARELARKELGADAVLGILDVEYVNPQGRAELKWGGDVRYWYRSAAAAAAVEPPRTEPLGAPHRWEPPPCVVQVYLDRHRKLDTNVEHRARRDHRCGEPLGAVHCTLADVWREAQRRGAPERALARIRLMPHAGAPAWHFTIRDEGHTIFTMDWPDRCGDAVTAPAAESASQNKPAAAPSRSAPPNK